MSGTAYTLAYDYDGQIISITQGSSVVSFAYDASGRRLSRTAGGTTTNFLYDGGKIVLEKQGSSTTATCTYGNALIRKDGETPLFDGLGSERTVTNSSQTVTGTLTQDGFGNTVATTGSSSNPYMYAATSGYRNDGDAGLSHVGARYYDAQVGRFITRDTYLDQKPYLYCDHDPVNAVDPSGHMPWWGRVIVNLARDGEYFGTGLTIGGLLAEGVMAIAEIKKAQREKEEWRRKHNDGSASWIANRHDDPRPSDPRWGNGKRDLPGSDRPLRQEDPEYSILH